MNLAGGYSYYHALIGFDFIANSSNLGIEMHV